MADLDFYEDNKRYLIEFLRKLDEPVADVGCWYDSHNSWEFADDLLVFGLAVLNSSNCPVHVRGYLKNLTDLVGSAIGEARSQDGFVSWAAPVWDEVRAVAGPVCQGLQAH